MPVCPKSRRYFAPTIGSQAGSSCSPDSGEWPASRPNSLSLSALFRCVLVTHAQDIPDVAGFGELSAFFWRRNRSSVDGREVALRQRADGELSNACRRTAKRHACARNATEQPTAVAVSFVRAFLSGQTPKWARPGRDDHMQNKSSGST